MYRLNSVPSLHDVLKITKADYSSHHHHHQNAHFVAHSTFIIPSAEIKARHYKTEGTFLEVSHDIRKDSVVCTCTH